MSQDVLDNQSSDEDTTKLKERYKAHEKLVNKKLSEPPKHLDNSSESPAEVLHELKAFENVILETIKCNLRNHKM